MITLCIETSTTVCSAAWCTDGQTMAQRICTRGSNHAALLPVFIEELLTDARQQNWQPDAVAVSAGPGSYTGLRIGVSTAKGLCYGWNVPLIAVPTLDILCQSFLTHYPLPTTPLPSTPLPTTPLPTTPLPTTPLPTTPLPTTLLPMIDARRMEVYTALYHLTPDGWRGSDAMAKIVNDKEWLPQTSDIYFFGDGAAKCQQVLQDTHIHFTDQIIPSASALGAAVASHPYPLIGQKELAYYTPFYLKEFVAAPSHIKGLK